MKIYYVARCHVLDCKFLKIRGEVFLSSVSQFLFCFVLAMPRGMWDLGFPSRDQTHAPCIGSVES